MSFIKRNRRKLWKELRCVIRQLQDTLHDYSIMCAVCSDEDLYDWVKQKREEEIIRICRKYPCIVGLQDQWVSATTTHPPENQTVCYLIKHRGEWLIGTGYRSKDTDLIFPWIGSRDCYSDDRVKYWYALPKLPDVDGDTA